jgi:hypothetical protein
VPDKSYELKDHLGNVRVVVSDDKRADVSLKVNAPGDTLVNPYLRAGVRSQSSYYPFGMQQPGGVYNASDSLAPPVNSGLSLTSGAISNTYAMMGSVSNSFTVEAWVLPSSTHQIDPEATTGTSTSTEKPNLCTATGSISGSKSKCPPARHPPPTGSHGACRKTPVDPTGCRFSPPGNNSGSCRPTTRKFRKSHLPRRG